MRLQTRYMLETEKKQDMVTTQYYLSKICYLFKMKKELQTNVSGKLQKRARYSEPWQAERRHNYGREASQEMACSVHESILHLNFQLRCYAYIISLVGSKSILNELGNSIPNFSEIQSVSHASCTIQPHNPARIQSHNPHNELPGKTIHTA